MGTAMDLSNSPKQAVCFRCTLVLQLNLSNNQSIKKWRLWIHISKLRIRIYSTSNSCWSIKTSSLLSLTHQRNLLMKATALQQLRLPPHLPSNNTVHHHKTEWLLQHHILIFIKWAVVHSIMFIKWTILVTTYINSNNKQTTIKTNSSPRNQASINNNNNSNNINMTHQLLCSSSKFQHHCFNSTKTNELLLKRQHNEFKLRLNHVNNIRIRYN